MIAHTEYSNAYCRPIKPPKALGFQGLSLGLLALTGIILLQGQARAETSLVPDFFGIDGNSALVNLADQTGASTFYSNGIIGQNVSVWVVDAQLAGTNLFPALGFTNLAAPMPRRV